MVFISNIKALQQTYLGHMITSQCFFHFPSFSHITVSPMTFIHIQWTFFGMGRCLWKQPARKTGPSQQVTRRLDDWTEAFFFCGGSLGKVTLTFRGCNGWRLFLRIQRNFRGIYWANQTFQRDNHTNIGITIGTGWFQWDFQAIFDGETDFFF